MFGSYPSPYIVIVMLAAAGVSLPLLFWLRTRLSWINSSLRIWPVAVVATALFLLLASSGPLLKVFGQETPPVVGAWTFETVIDPNPLETGSVGGATVTFRAIFTVDQASPETPTALSGTITTTGVGKGVAASFGTNPDSGRIGIGASIDADLSISGDAKFSDDPCESDLDAGTVTCELDILGLKKLFAKSGATPASYNLNVSFPSPITFTAIASTAGQDSFTAATSEKAAGEDTSLGLQMEVTLGPPSSPTGLSATAGDSQITINWDDPMDSSITKYQISQDGGSWTDIPTSAPGETNTTSYTVSGLINGVSYTFAIRAVNSVGRGPTSAEVSKKPRPGTENTAYFKPSDTLYALKGPTNVRWGETVTYVNKVGVPPTRFAVRNGRRQENSGEGRRLRRLHCFPF